MKKRPHNRRAPTRGSAARSAGRPKKADGKRPQAGKGKKREKPPEPVRRSMEVMSLEEVDWQAQIRNLDPPEEEALAALLQEFGVEPSVDWKQGRELRVVARDDLEPRRRVVLVQPDLMAVVGPFEPQTVGLPIAHLARKGARLTLEGAGFLAPFATRRVVHASEKGETLFLYGRTLLVQGVKKTVGPVQTGDEVLVLRAGDQRCIGIGIAASHLNAGDRYQNRDEVAVTNRADLGRYLRDAQEVLE